MIQPPYFKNNLEKIPGTKVEQKVEFPKNFLI